jgi:competence protein ComEA
MRRVLIGFAGAALALTLFLASPSSAADQLLNVNTATAAELTSLSGIGPAKAQSIVEYREKNGEFKTVDDLRLVRGIGDRMLEQLRSQVTVGDPKPAPHEEGR